MFYGGLASAQEPLAVPRAKEEVKESRSAEKRNIRKVFEIEGKNHWTDFLADRNNSKFALNAIGDDGRQTGQPDPTLIRILQEHNLYSEILKAPK